MSLKRQGRTAGGGLERAIRGALRQGDAGAESLQCAIRDREAPDAPARTDAFLALRREKLEP